MFGLDLCPKSRCLGEGRRENRHPLFLEHQVRDWQDREAETFQTHSYRKPTLIRKAAKNKEHCRREALKGGGGTKIKDIKNQETDRDKGDKRKHTRSHTRTHKIAELLKEVGSKLELTAHANRGGNNPNLKTVGTEVTHLTQNQA